MSRTGSGSGTPKHASPTSTKSSLPSSSGKQSEKVWVAVRLRPLLPAEAAAKEQIAWRVAHQNTLIPLETGRAISATASTYSRVFEPECTSHAVYEQAGKRLILSSMEGYNSTIFAYGPTGSGKTFTMQAILQQSTQEIFDHIKQNPSREFLVRVSAIEIYNEAVRDLLGDSSGVPLKVLEDPERGACAEGLTEEGVESVAHLKQLLERVVERRKTRATESNDNSSRSHEIVRIYVESRPAPKKQLDAEEDDTAGAASAADTSTAASTAVTISTINFVDLAGSERLPAALADNMEMEKLRQKETGNINKSLLTLGSCIRALAEGKKFVPYRDSKLTRLLQPFLSGNAKMAIICTISPAAGAIEASKAALHFATTAKKVQVRPVVNEVKNSKTVIAKMQLEIQELRNQLARQQDVDVDQLSAQLKAKEDQIRMTADEVAEAQRKIESLQRQILCGTRLRVDGKCSAAGKQAGIRVAQSMMAVRASYHMGSPMTGRQAPSDLASAMSVLRGDKLLLDDYFAGGSRRRAKTAAAAPAAPAATAATAAGPAAAGSSSTAGITPISEGSEQATGALASVQESIHIQQLQEPSSPRAEAAVAALRNQVRCFHLVRGQSAAPAAGSQMTLHALKQQLSMLQGSVGSSTDSEQSEMVQAVRIEIARLEQAQQAQAEASRALESLCKKLGMVADGLLPAVASAARKPLLPPAAACAQPASAGVQRASLASAASSCGSDSAPHSKDTWAPLPPPGSMCQSPLGVGSGKRSPHEAARLSSQSDVSPYRPSPAAASALGAAAESWPNPQRRSSTPPAALPFRSAGSSVAQPRRDSKEDMVQQPDQSRPSSRLAEPLQHSVEKELAAMRTAFQNFSEQTERLETQKMVLVKQVLKLEYGLEKQEEARQQLQQQLEHVQAQLVQAQQEAERARAEAEAARRQAAAAAAGPGPSSQQLAASMSNFSMVAESEESWVAGASVEVLLPKIVALWEELYVPLVYRSRFFLGFRGHDAFYYEVEYRRLAWKRSAMFARDPTGRLHRTREVNRAARALDWERKSIAQQVKWDLTEMEREELFSAWRVDPLSKERKLQLVQKLWSRETLAQPDGMQRSSELVVQLCGMDASEHMMELVFGKFQREQEVGLKPSSSRVGFVMNNLMRKVVPPRRRAPGPAALQRPSPSLLGSFTSRINSGLMSFVSRREDSFTSAASFTTARSMLPGSRPGTSAGGAGR